MRHLAAYLLLQIGGNASPSAGDIKKVLGAVGIEADDDRLEKLISELEGKDVNALIAEGSSKLASVRCLGCALHQCWAKLMIHGRYPLVVRLLLRLAVLQVGRPPLPLRKRRRRRRRKRRSVFCLWSCDHSRRSLSLISLQEESDDDMGFGLFD